MKIALEISVSSGLWRGLPRARALARETIAAAAAESGFALGEGAELSLCLADDACLRALNLRWRGVDKPTNVLSFPAAPVDAADSPSIDGRPLDRVCLAKAAGVADRAQRARLQTVGRGPRPRLQLGDIALAYETLAREASELGVPLADHYRHLVAHGFLHLLGYDHETEREAERMEALETRIMARLGAAEPYPREVADG